MAPDYKADSLNHFLDCIQENVAYGHWYMGHLHLDMDLWRQQTVLYYQVRKLS